MGHGIGYLTRFVVNELIWC